MALLSITSPHTAQSGNTGVVMRQVLYATVPAMLASSWYFGWGVIVNCLLASATAISCEAAILHIRKRPVVFYLKDYSALVTAILLALALPPLAPWWIPVLGMFFAIAFVKQAYGGLGSNPFNPAMAGYVFLLISFPIQMTSWLPADAGIGHSFSNPNAVGLWDALSLIFSGNTASGATFEAFTGATPLDALKTELSLAKTTEVMQNNPVFSGFVAGWGWEIINLGFLLGGLYLLAKGIISWQIPLSFIVCLAFLSSIFYLYDSDRFASPVFHLFSGGSMMCAFFIATDPVTAATSRSGRFIYGALIGFFVFIIRVFGGYPDAVAFSVLLLNLLAPTIDYYTQPRTYGHKHANRGFSKKDKS